MATGLSVTGENMDKKQVPAILLLSVCAMFTLLMSGCGQDTPERLRIGDDAPPFSIIDLEGERRSLDDWTGFPIILRFWDTECKYCRADSPIIDRYFNRFRERGLKVLYVATPNETEARVRSFIADIDIGFPVALDTSGNMTEDYQVNIVPQTIFISPERKIMTAMLGGVGEAELEELLGPYLKAEN